ncbi:hypothetical protein IW262DRAFT_1292404 [Armillaria fumosa]|nr:hypothetical protein IW262DRAFT_1292404 [Armillaria fumosa]
MSVGLHIEWCKTRAWAHGGEKNVSFSALKWVMSSKPLITRPTYGCLEPQAHLREVASSRQVKEPLHMQKSIRESFEKKWLYANQYIMLGETDESPAAEEAIKTYTDPPESFGDKAHSDIQNHASPSSPESAVWEEWGPGPGAYLTWCDPISHGAIQQSIFRPVGGRRLVWGADDIQIVTVPAAVGLCASAPFVQIGRCYISQTSGIVSTHTPLSFVTRIAQKMVHKSRSEEWRTIYVDDNDALTPCYNLSPNELPKPLYDIVTLGEENTLPIYLNLTDLHYYDLVPLHSRVCKIGEDSFLFKAQIDKRLFDWGRQLDEEYYITLRLRDSPHVLPLHGLVRATHWNVFPDDPIAQRVVVLDGFLVPFVGSHSELFHDGEWTVYEKEVLAVAHVDTLYDIDSRGISPSNVDANTTARLTSDGLKVVGAGLHEVDQNFLFFYSPDCYRHAKAKILGALSAIVCHLFTEQRPSLSSVDNKNIPNLFRDMVRHAMGTQTTAQLRQEMWEELQEIRERGVTVLDLVQKRHSRFERQVSSKNT